MFKNVLRPLAVVLFSISNLDNRYPLNLSLEKFVKSLRTNLYLWFSVTKIQYHLSAVFNINFKQTSDIVLKFPFLSLNK